MFNFAFARTGAGPWAMNPATCDVAPQLTVVRAWSRADRKSGVEPCMETLGAEPVACQDLLSPDHTPFMVAHTVLTYSRCLYT